MKLAFVLSMYIVMNFAQAESGPESDKSIWYKCRKDSECTLAAGACGPDAVNKKYKSEFEEHAKKIAPYVDCMPNDKIKRKAICYKQTCSLKPARP